MTRFSRGTRFQVSVFGGVVASVFCAACSLSSLVDSTAIPLDVRDPNAIRSPDGAIGAYYGTLVKLADALTYRNSVLVQAGYIYTSGVLTDELRSYDVAGAFPSTEAGLIDSRNLEAGSENLFGSGPFSLLHSVRFHSQIARNALRKYAPYSPSEWVGHLYAVEGFAEILLAELYCSGIPLSTVDLAGDYTLTRGYTTEEVYAHAMRLLDSAEKYSGDSLRFKHFANLSRARILLALGKYDDGASVVTRVPENYQYTVSFDAARKKLVTGVSDIIIGHKEGENGLLFLTDPRTQRPELRDTIEPLVVTSGLEAQLIRAEANLHSGGADWLVILNRLRTTCTTAVDCPSPAPAGVGGVAGLPPLSDPDPDSLPPEKTIQDARIDLLFAERAYWLFLTGHRQGDLRRMVRVYGRPSETVYPIGAWGNQRIAPYGPGVSLPVSRLESERNPFYGGCVSHDA